MTTFEVGKKYSLVYSDTAHTCVAVFNDVPVFMSDGEGGVPWVPTFFSSYIEYVEPKPPIIVERWVNYYLRKDNTVSAQLFKSAFDADRDFTERLTTYQRNPLTCVKPLKTVYTKEQFDAV